MEDPSPIVTGNTINREVAAGKRLLAGRLTDLGVDHKLGAARRGQLVGIVLQFSAALENRRSYPMSEKLARIERKSGERQRRRFRAKVKEAVAAVGDALSYATTVERKNPVFAKSLRNFAIPFLREAEKSLNGIPLHWGNFTQSNTFCFKDPESEATEALHSFFIKTCGLASRDADRRTAIIGNEFWNWGVAVDDEWINGSPGARGSSAIRKRRTRRVKRSQPPRSST